MSQLKLLTGQSGPVLFKIRAPDANLPTMGVRVGAKCIPDYQDILSTVHSVPWYKVLARDPSTRHLDGQF